MAAYERLLTKYGELKDELLEYTDEFHDAMLFDIEGFNSIPEDEKLLFEDELKNNVLAFKKILTGLKAVKYTFS